MAQQDYDYVLKIVVIGDANVGKSSLVLRCVDKSYSDNYFTTIGLDYKIKRLQLDGKLLKICIWDTAGQERFRAITNGYYRDAHGIIVVYDITNQKSYESVKIWMDEIKKRAHQNVNILLVGNKSDLLDEREVFFECANSYAEDLGIPFLETSAKNSLNVELAVITMASAIKNRIVEQVKQKAKMTNGDLDKKASCCSLI